MSFVLSEHLPLLTTAPDGIQKLRGLILELAVRGKLVPQDSRDEPATKLLKRIAIERTRLEAEGVLRKSKATPVSPDERSSNSPQGWTWIRLSQLGEFRGGKTPSTNRPEYWEGAIPWVSPKDMKSLVVSQTEDYVSELAISDGLAVIPASSVLIVVRSGILRRTVPVAINSLQCTVNQDLKALCLVLPDMARYIQLLIRGFERLILKNLTKVGTTVESIKFEEFSQHLFPLPPVAEQHRIVAKVDELMALCDLLEVEQADAEAAHCRLIDTLLGTLTQSADAADLAAKWQRHATHFDTLFTTESSLSALKQTILQLAVMGKLVPQDRSEEPVSELLKRIAQEKDRLSTEEGLRTTAEAQIAAEEHYVEIPAGWCFQRLGNLAKFIDYRGKTPGKIKAGVPLITAKNVRFGFISREPYEFISEKEYAEWMTRGFPRVGDILFTTEAPLGNVAVVDIEEKFALAQRVICFQLHEPHTAAYLRLALMSKQVSQKIQSEATGMTATGIKASRLKEIPVPLPPLAEQHRIVAKVDELMALCDRLKADLAESRNRQARLASTFIETALDAT